MSAEKRPVEPMELVERELIDAQAKVKEARNELTSVVRHMGMRPEAIDQAAYQLVAALVAVEWCRWSVVKELGR